MRTFKDFVTKLSGQTHYTSIGEIQDIIASNATAENPKTSAEVTIQHEPHPDGDKKQDTYIVLTKRGSGPSVRKEFNHANFRNHVIHHMNTYYERTGRSKPPRYGKSGKFKIDMEHKPNGKIEIKTYKVR